MRESKQERFIRIAENRTNKIIALLRLLGNCANTNNYDYSAENVDKIFDVIKTEMNDAKNKFVSNKRKNIDFKLE